jgi:hypothetical protein
MTTREYFQAVLDAHISDEMDAASATLIQKLDEKNAKRKATPTKDQREAAARRDKVWDFLKSHSGEAFTRDAISENVGVTPAQVTAACRALGDNVSKSEAKIDKVRRVVYSVAE